MKEFKMYYKFYEIELTYRDFVDNEQCTNSIYNCWYSLKTVKENLKNIKEYQEFYKEVSLYTSLSGGDPTKVKEICEKYQDRPWFKDIWHLYLILDDGEKLSIYNYWDINISSAKILQRHQDPKKDDMFVQF